MNVESVQSDYVETVEGLIDSLAYELTKLPRWFRRRLLDAWQQLEDEGTAEDASVVGCLARLSHCAQPFGYDYVVVK